MTIWLLFDLLSKKDDQCMNIPRKSKYDLVEMQRQIGRTKLDTNIIQILPELMK